MCFVEKWIPDALSFIPATVSYSDYWDSAIHSYCRNVTSDLSSEVALKEICWLLKHGASLKTLAPNGNSVLHVVMSKKQLTLTKFIIEAEPSLSRVKNLWNENPLEYMNRCQYCEQISTIFENAKME